MPLPPYLISASIFVCERILHEADGVVSAIRIVDIFYVPEPPPSMPENALPLVQAYGCAILKSVAGHNEEHSIQLKMINTIGEITVVGEPVKTRIGSTAGLEKVPGGATINAQLNIGVKRLGTCYLCVEVDGEEVTRAPFTLLRLAEKNG